MIYKIVEYLNSLEESDIINQAFGKKIHAKAFFLAISDLYESNEEAVYVVPIGGSSPNVDNIRFYPGFLIVACHRRPRNAFDALNLILKRLNSNEEIINGKILALDSQPEIISSISGGCRCFAVSFKALLKD